MSVQGPWQMAAMGFFAVERADEGHRLRVDAELVRVDHAAGQEQCVEILHPRLGERHVDGDVVTPVGELPPSHLAFDRRHDLRHGPGLVERLARLRELDLLETILDDDRHPLSFQFVRHGTLPRRAKHRSG